MTLRIVAGVGSLRRGKTAHVIRQAIRACHKPGFHVVHFAVLSNHVHLIAEAADAEHLARGVQGLAVRVARRTNRALERRGALFADRRDAVRAGDHRLAEGEQVERTCAAVTRVPKSQCGAAVYRCASW